MKVLARLLILFIAFSLNAQKQIEYKGISFSAANKITSTADIQSMLDVNANSVAVVPYAFLANNELKYNSSYQWEGEKPEAIRKCIHLSHGKGLKVMLKPHVWIGFGAYTGNYACQTEVQWKQLEEGYRDYIMFFVDMAVEEKVELFCIGTEWGKFVSARPEFWVKLIADIREKYQGKLIYAANWDDFQRVPFWKDLDYIGIDAYFPLSLGANPKLSELTKSWNTITSLIEKYATSQKKEVVFTEFGYKSTTHATISPWEHKDAGKFSEKIQDLAFQSYFATIWKKAWFKGGFVWKWFHDHSKVGGEGDLDFTPQNKLAEQTIRANYE